MFSNYLKVTIRNMFKEKALTGINILGLSMGITSCILIFLFIRHELSYDTFHKNADRIYRISYDMKARNQTSSIYIPPEFYDYFQTEIPELSNITRYSELNSIVCYNNNSFNEKISFVDLNFFNNFTFTLLQGEASSCLTQPYSVVITESIAEKYFGHSDPIGKTISIKLASTFCNFQITGVAKSPPSNSSIQFHLLLPFKNCNVRNHWLKDHAKYFVIINEKSKINEIKAKIKSLISKYRPHDIVLAVNLQLFKNIHSSKLSSNIYFPNIIDIRSLYILTGIVLAILMIACINFMNISISRSVIRANEVGVRKVCGANHLDIMIQFWGETLVISILALLFSMGIIELLLPFFNSFIGVRLKLEFLNLSTILFLVGMMLFVGLMAGIYHAFILAKFHPIDVLRNKIRAIGPDIIRRILVLFQFSVSIFLLISTLIASKQLHFMKSKDLGFNKEQVVVVSLVNIGNKNEKERTFHLYKNAIKSYPQIINVSGSTSIPSGGSGAYVIAGYKGRDIFYYHNRVDYEYFKTMGIQLLKGRNFSKSLTTDSKEAMIVNETFVKKFEIDSVLGEKIMGKRIIGVMKDYHISSLHQPIIPVALHLSPELSYDWINIKLAANNIPTILKLLKNKWKEIAPNYPFEFNFLDERIENNYKRDEQLNKMNTYSSIITLLIACLGVFGLTKLNVTNRTKEIGIRKVLGATVPGVVFMLLKDISKWVLLSNIIAWPIAYYAINKWLQNFAYRINIDIWTFLLASLLVLIIALLTVSYQAIRAVTTNPIEALRYE